MSTIWVMPDTGEQVAEDTPGALEVEGEPIRRDDGDDAAWLGDHLTRQHCRIDAEEAAIKAQSKALLGELAARRKALAWAYEKRLQRVVEDAIAGGKKKSVNFAYGKAGFRKSKRIEVEDEMAAMAWADQHCPAAIKPAKPTLLKSKLPDPRGVPGIKVVEENAFYVRAAKEAK